MLWFGGAWQHWLNLQKITQLSTNKQRAFSAGHHELYLPDGLKVTWTCTWMHLGSHGTQLVTQGETEDKDKPACRVSESDRRVAEIILSD